MLGNYSCDWNSQSIWHVVFWPLTGPSPGPLAGFRRLSQTVGAKLPGHPDRRALGHP
jgi:hypothetical protein